ncbi:MAG: isopeptide-forming domain-containing fimbrial protein, partial [Polyangiaceae bacterium]|nr:isopeptide-forming domain-containing fimbrial protein [Polyangiaceae bacterium]
MVSKRSRTALSLLFTFSSLLQVSSAQAGPNDPTLRFQKDLKGDIAVFGSTLAHDCGTKAALPQGATVSCAGQNNIADTAPDIYWRDNVANGSIEPLQARTSATLKMPPGSKVVYARLYWAAIKKGNAPDTTATLDWLGGPSTVIKADATWTQATNLNSLPDTFYYQASGDATAFISEWGAGDFRVTDVDGLPLAGLNLDRAFTGWTMVVFFENESEQLRNLALFDGFTYIAPAEGTKKVEVDLKGFLVPPGFDAKMTALTYEGDTDYGGDFFLINGNKASDALNPENNFFNSSRSVLGSAVSGDFDVPKLSGLPGIMSGYDLDTVDISKFIKPNDTSAKIGAQSDLDIFILGAFATSITNKAPNFTVTKTANDLDGGALLPGDEIEFTITLTNTGNDPSIDTVLTDVLEPGLEYIPGSITLNGAPKTDTSGDDEAQYSGATSTLSWFLGSAAGPSKGGKVAVGASITVSFRAKISADKEEGSVSNQALLKGVGEAIRVANPAAPLSEWLSDGDPNEVGPQKTVVVIKECETSADCNDLTKPFCDTTTFTCQPCKTDANCTNPLLPACQPDGSCNECSESNQGFCKNDEPICNVPTGTCTVCKPATSNDPGDASKCDNNPDGEACIAGVGGDNFCGCTKDSDCGSPTSGRVCDTADTLKCIDGCRGEGGNGCPTTLLCTSKDSSIGKCVNDPEDTDAKCSDGLDNDGDGKTDCDDSDCKNSSISACKENTDAKCKDGVDNDGDSQTDCDDSDCKDNPAITVCATKEDTNEKCKDGKDNDGDGKTDCDDPDCKVEGITTCADNAENTDAKCSDGVDNDSNGLIDCADPACGGTAPCSENTEEKCKDGKDNDADKKIDCQDPGCKALPFCGDENTDEKCKDGIDNDGDGLVDCEDSSCVESPSVTVCPSAENTDGKCKDGLDNDGDGLSDCDDPECKSANLTACADPTDGKGKGENTDAKCSDGVDNDGDGQIDCADQECRATDLSVCKVPPAGDNADVSQEGGCGCAVPGQSRPLGSPALLLGLAGLGLLLSRRRSRLAGWGCAPG